MRGRSSARRGRASSVNAPPGARIRLGFWAGEEFNLVGASLVNLCGDGLLVIADGAIPHNQTAWVRFDGPGSAESVSVDVLGATPLRHGRCALRLELGEDSPPGFLEAMVERLARNRCSIASE
jgi:hypothetical protein